MLIDKRISLLLLFFLSMCLYAFSAWSALPFAVLGLVFSFCIFGVYISLFRISFSFHLLCFYLFFLLFAALQTRFETSGLYVFLQLVFSSFVIFFAGRCFSSAGVLKFFVLLPCALLVVFFLAWLAGGLVLFKPWIFSELNPNVMGFICYLVVFFISIGFFLFKGFFKKLFFVFLLLIAFFLVAVSGARSVLGAFVFSIFIFILIRNFNLGWRFFTLFFFAVFAFSPILSYFYAGSVDAGGAQDLSVAIFDATGKSLYTGREQIWSILFDAIEKNPFFGLGLGFDLEQLGIDVSAHNFYLIMLLQFGIVGYILFSVWFYLLVRFVRGGAFRQNSRVSDLALAWFLSVLMQQNFEQFLFQNNLAASFMLWFIVGVAFSYNPRFDKLKE